MYLLLGLFISVLALVEANRCNSLKGWWFPILMIMLTLLLCCRYGQGSDYYGYFLHFDYIDANASYMVNALYHGEIGWYALMLFCKKIGMNFEAFIAVISLLMMLMVWRTFKKHSSYPIMSILLLYPTYYMTYCNSAIRQGLVLCIFLGVGIDLILSNKYKHYIILVLGLILIHKSAIALLAVPLFLKIKFKSSLFWIIIAGVVSLGLSKAAFMISLSQQFSEGGYMEESFSIGGVAMRLILYGIIYMMYKPLAGSNEKIDKLYNLYLWGLLIFMALSFSGTLSQRLSMPYKALEVILIPSLLYANRNNLYVTNHVFDKSKLLYMAIAVVVLMNAETYKNLNSYIEQGNYHSWVTPLSYPYISIFNEDEIWQYITHFDQ